MKPRSVPRVRVCATVQKASYSLATRTTVRALLSPEWVSECEGEGAVPGRRGQRRRPEEVEHAKEDREEVTVELCCCTLTAPDTLLDVRDV